MECAEWMIIKIIKVVKLVKPVNLVMLVKLVNLALLLRPNFSNIPKKITPFRPEFLYINLPQNSGLVTDYKHRLSL